MQGERREAMQAHRLSLSTQQIAKDPAPCGLGKVGSSAVSGLLDGGQHRLRSPFLHLTRPYSTEGAHLLSPDPSMRVS